MSERARVPCAGCQACCKRETIALHPEHGDLVESYLTELMPHPFLPVMMSVVQHKPNGDCIYLDATGCSIWHRAPAICREFDCRLSYLKFTSAQRRQLLKAGRVDPEVMAAGKQRLASL